MIRRHLASKLRQAARKYPVVTLTGPRQSGKTTLVKAELKGYHYVSLELPDQRRHALEDPRGFLSAFDGPVILDEAQRAPELFSYIQVSADEDDRPGRFILTGSENFLLLQSISQSLAGRCAILHLLPFSLHELAGRPALAPEVWGRELPRQGRKPRRGLMDTLFTGFYPRIHDKKLAPQEWLANYYQTYLERDVRNVLKVGDLEAFGRFVRLCAGRNGQLLNLNGLASDCGISQPTAKSWLSVLEASFMVALVRPHHRNFGKRLIKSPKLYFLDPGLLCYLSRVGSPKDLHQHGARGPVFETFVLSELYKAFAHRGQRPEVYFWRDSAGHEVDFLLDFGTRLVPIEAKSAQTVAGDFFDALRRRQELAGHEGGSAALVYGGDHAMRRRDVFVYPWSAV
ncbi:MAG: ATP-binding protein [Elusimicrobiota bacterium]